MDAVTVPEESARRATMPADCPLFDDAVRAVFKEATHVASDLSLRMRDFLHDRTPDEQAAWIQSSMTVSRDLFQPWSMELLYVTAVQDRVRFSQLERMLGISSRTLSNKLRRLTEAGFLRRIVLDETPVRVEYRLTKSGRATAALAAPLFAHLNLHAVRD